MDYETRWLDGRARLTPHHVALRDQEGNERTYRQLVEKAADTARFLLSRGIAKGDRIALLSWNEIAYFDLLFAAHRIGAIFLPINARLNENEIAYILQDAGASILFYGDSFAPTVLKLKEVGIHLPAFSLQELKEAAGSQEELFTLPERRGEDPWVMLYTGGTTGKPKGVVLSEHNILWNAINTVASWSLSNRDITYTVMPLFHTGGLNALTIPILYAGGTVILGRQFDPGKTIRIVAEERVTILLLVPTMHLMVLDHPLLDQVQFGHDPIFLSGGAPCPLTIYEGYRRRGIRFKEGYGLTEAGPNNFYLSPEEAQHKKGSVGKPMMHNKITLLDEQGREVPIGEVGELVIEGPHLFTRYWNNEEETRKTLRDGRLFTGDLAKRDEDGYYYIVGRKKEMYISGGENIYPLEIETVLHQHPSIAEAVVIGVPDERWGEIGVAFIVGSKEAKPIRQEEIIAYCEKHLARYKIPKKWMMLEALPKTAVGKIDRKALLHHYRTPLNPS